MDARFPIQLFESRHATVGEQRMVTRDELIELLSAGADSARDKNSLPLLVPQHRRGGGRKALDGFERGRLVALDFDDASRARHSARAVQDALVWHPTSTPGRFRGYYLLDREVTDAGEYVASTIALAQQYGAAMPEAKTTVRGYYYGSHVARAGRGTAHAVTRAAAIAQAQRDGEVPYAEYAAVCTQEVISPTAVRARIRQSSADWEACAQLFSGNPPGKGERHAFCVQLVSELACGFPSATIEALNDFIIEHYLEKHTDGKFAHWDGFTPPEGMDWSFSTWTEGCARKRARVDAAKRKALVADIRQVEAETSDDPWERLKATVTRQPWSDSEKLRQVVCADLDICIGRPTVLVSRPGEGKTWHALALARHFTELNGPFKMRGGRVLFLTGEMSTKQMADRVRRMNTALLHELDVMSTEALHGWEDWCSVLTTICDTYDMVIIDALGSSGLVDTLGADDNARKQIQDRLGDLRYLSERTSTAFVLIHHTTKVAGDKFDPSNEASIQNAMEGSSTMLKHLGRIWYVQKRESPTGVMNATLWRGKASVGPSSETPPARLDLRLVFEDGDTRWELGHTAPEDGDRDDGMLSQVTGKPYPPACIDRKGKLIEKAATYWDKFIKRNYGNDMTMAIPRADFKLPYLEGTTPPMELRTLTRVLSQLQPFEVTVMDRPMISYAVPGYFEADDAKGLARATLDAVGEDRNDLGRRQKRYQDMLMRIVNETELKQMQRSNAVRTESGLAVDSSLRRNAGRRLDHVNRSR